MRHTSEMTFGVVGEVGVPRKGLNYKTDPADSRGMYLVAAAFTYAYTCVCVCPRTLVSPCL